MFGTPFGLDLTNLPLNCCIKNRHFFLGIIFASTLVPFNFVLQGTSQLCSMRLFHVLLALGLLFGARASLSSRDPVPHRLDVRDTPDVCGPLSYSFGLSGTVGEFLKFTGKRVLSYQ